MSPWHWFRPPRHLLVVFLFIVLLPSTLLVVSGWRLLQQEEMLAAQALQEQMAAVAVSSLQQKIASLEVQLRSTSPESAVAAGGDSVVVVFSGNALASAHGVPLLYYPTTAPALEPPARAFADGEQLERDGRDAEAAVWYRRTAASRDPAVRAGASIREARSLLRLGQTSTARVALARMATIDDVSIDGVPANLFARWMECGYASGQDAELRTRAASLHADLLTGRWHLSRQVFDANLEDAARWAGAAATSDSTARARAMSSAVEWAWEKRRAAPSSTSLPTGREQLAIAGRRLTVLWHGDANRFAVFVAGPDVIDTQWLGELRATAARQQLTITLREPGAPPSPNEARQIASETNLPWTIAVTSAGPPRAATGDRFRIWLASVAVLALIVIAGTTVIARAAARELAVARLQSDFVAAVSHEFRTPLTSLRQIGEVLQDGRVASDERRRTYFDALVRQTDRLAHLVETLLDFGRMEAGTSPYRKEPLNLSSWVRSVIEQFNLESAGRGYAVELSASDEAVSVQGDPQALTNALWNLLDNAVKYSPDCRTVWVTIDRRGDEVVVHVRDRGLGVPAAEHRDIFQKFVRGAEAKRQNIAGTGIGLAMVQHIMKAHGGSVRVESEPGHGSTFTLVMPCHAS